MTAVSRYPVFGRTFLGIVFKPSAIATILHAHGNGPGSKMYAGGLSGPAVPQNVRGRSFFFSGFTLVPTAPGTGFISLTLGGERSMHVRGLVVNVTRFYSFKTDSPIPTILPLCVLDRSPVFTHGLFVSGSRYGIAVFIMS